MRELTIAVVQMKPQLGEMEDNLVKMSDMITKIASQQRVDLIVFPELVTSGFELGVRFTELAQRVPGPTVNLMAQRANENGVYVAFGMVTKEKVESVLYNSAVMVGPEGDLVQTYNKIHLRGEERMAFREGYKMPVVDVPELGTVGMMVGYDLAYPEVARSMALDGAEIIICLANWEAANIDEWKTYARARAYENSVYIVAVNRVGEDVTLTFGGESMVIGPRGQIYASMVDETDPETGAPMEGFTVARIDLDTVRKFREEYQFMQTRQPATYRTVVKKY
jgi:predicted amidohydrolase